MKKITIAMMLALRSMSCQSQSIDTVQTFDYGKMPPVYFSNKVYWERNYDSQNHLLFEGLKYNSCFIGDFVNYWKNGNIKTKSQYKPMNPDDSTELKKGGLCSVQEGTWKNYNEEGELKETFEYKDGKIIKE